MHVYFSLTIRAAITTLSQCVICRWDGIEMYFPFHFYIISLTFPWEKNLTRDMIEHFFVNISRTISDNLYKFWDKYLQVKCVDMSVEWLTRWGNGKEGMSEWRIRLFVPSALSPFRETREQVKWRGGLSILTTLVERQEKTAESAT